MDKLDQALDLQRRAEVFDNNGRHHEAAMIRHDAMVLLDEIDAEAEWEEFCAAHPFLDHHESEDARRRRRAIGFLLLLPGIALAVMAIVAVLA